MQAGSYIFTWGTRASRMAGSESLDCRPSLKVRTPSWYAPGREESSEMSDSSGTASTRSAAHAPNARVQFWMSCETPSSSPHCAPAAGPHSRSSARVTVSASGMRPSLTSACARVCAACARRFAYVGVWIRV